MPFVKPEGHMAPRWGSTVQHAKHCAYEQHDATMAKKKKATGMDRIMLRGNNVTHTPAMLSGRDAEAPKIENSAAPVRRSPASRRGPFRTGP